MEKEVKGDARNDRLVLRKTNEEVFRKQHHNEGIHRDIDQYFILYYQLISLMYSKSNMQRKIY